jgi:CubicO group peptidase (beta-lactamase class C family)
MLKRVLCLFAVLAATATASAQSLLTPGRTIRGAVARGDTARYRLDADSAHIIRISVDQISVNAIVRVLGPKSNVLRVSNSAPRGVEQLQLETFATGAYQVQVIPVDSASGEYAITLVAREPLSSDPARLVDQLLAPWDRRDGPGAAVAVWRGGRTLFTKAYGMANLAYDIPFTVTTPTNIGSTSKQFTAFAVMLLVDDGKLALDDDIRKHIPELPDLGARVTVRNLLTHTTGYREIYNAYVLAGRRIDEGDYVSRDEMISLIQRQPTLQNTPGAEFNYNNTSFGLLALLVERVSKQPFPEFMTHRVFTPLGMTHSVVRSDRHGIVRGATVGYSRAASGEWRDLGDLASSMGAGGIYTTVGDLQKWAENYAHPRVGSAAAIAQMMTPFTLTDGKSTGYGFGLFIDTQGPVKRVHHGGADISHRSMLAYYPGLGAGITVQSNDGSFDASLAFRIAKAFFPEITPRNTAAAGAAFDAATFDPARFDQFVGRYALDLAPTVVMTFTRSADSLSIQLTGQPKFPIFPTSDSTYALRVVPAAVTFHRDAGGKVTGLTLHQNGDNHATRLEGAAGAPAKAWTPTAAELTAFAGHYFSEELESFYDVSVVGGKLVLAGRRTDDATFVPSAKDTFSGTGEAASVTIAFERDRNGQVIAYYAGNGRTRNVRFARVR